MASAGNPNFFTPSNPNNTTTPSSLSSSSSYPPPPSSAHYSPQQQQERPFPQHSHNHHHGARLMALLTSSSTSSPSLEDSTPPNLSTSHSQPAPLRLSSNKPPRGRCLTADHRLVYDISVRNPGEVQPQLEVTPITKYVSDPTLVLGRQIAVNKSYICYGLKLGAIRILNINTALRALLKGHTQRVTDMAFFAEDVHLLASASIDGRIFIWKIDEGPDKEDKPQITGKVVIGIQMIGDGESVHPRICWHSHKQEILVVGIGKRVLKIDTTKVGKGEVYSTEDPLKCYIDNLIDGVQLVGEHDGEITDLSMCQWMTTRLVSASSDGMVKVWGDRKTLPLAVLKPHDGQPINSARFLTAPHSPEHIILVTAGPLNREVKIWVSASEEGWLLPSDADSWKCTQILDLKSSAEVRAGDAFFNQVVALPHAGLVLLANAKKNAIYAVHIEYGLCPVATHMDYIAEFTVTMPILSLTGTSDSLPDGNHIIQVYCVQTQAIQQYALDLSQCLPPPLENMGLEKADSSASHTFEASFSNGFTTLEASQGSAATEVPIGGSTFNLHRVSSSESAQLSRYRIYSGAAEVPNLHDLSTEKTKQYTLPRSVFDADSTYTGLPSVPLSPRLSGKSSGLRSPSNTIEVKSLQGVCTVDHQVFNHPVEGRVEAVPTSLPNVSSFVDNSGKAKCQNLENDVSVVPMDDNSGKVGNKVLECGVSEVPNAPRVFKQPTHLITPAEILSMSVSSSDNIKGQVINSGLESVDTDVNVVHEKEECQQNKFESQRESDIVVAENKEISSHSQVLDNNITIVRDCCALPTEPLRIEVGKVDNARVMEGSKAGGEELQHSSKNIPASVSDSTIETVAQTPIQVTKAKKQKGKKFEEPGSSSTSPNPSDSMDSMNEPCNRTTFSCPKVSISHIQALQEAVNQIMTTQKEMQTQMSAMVAAPVIKEVKRVEAALGRSMEKTIKANTDAFWARFQEDASKNESSEQESTQQMMSSIINCMNKELPSMLEKALKKELAALGHAVTRLVTPAMEKTISSSITESFQKGIGDKAVNLLEKSVSAKLESTVGRQIQTQFQTSGRQALQDVLKSSLEASMIPAFEKSCTTMFEQVNAAFQKGMMEHSVAALQQLDSGQSSLALSLKDALHSVKSITQTLSGELSEGQRKLVALATAGANSKTVDPLATQLSNGSLGSLHEKVEVPLDPTIELTRLISEGKFAEAFTTALQRSDVSIVSWLCSQVDLQRILAMVPPPLSQGVLLALLQQLAWDISTETSLKLKWMTDTAIAINPADPMIAMHIRPIFDQVYQILGHHRALPTTTTADASTIRLLMHVITSVLISCK